MSADTDAVEVRGPILDVYRGQNGPRGHLGFPVRPRRLFDDGGRLQPFQYGLIAGPSRKRVYAVSREFAPRYRRSGSVDGPWGYPVGHSSRVVGAEHGKSTTFQHVTVYWSEATRTRWLNGPIRRHYHAAENGPAGRLGYPVTDVEEVEPGKQRARFEHGEIIWDETTKKATVLPPA